MFNREQRAQAEAALERVMAQHGRAKRSCESAMLRLLKSRQEVATQVIKAAEAAVNRLAHTPKEFAAAVADLRLKADDYDKTLRGIQGEAKLADLCAARTAGGGMAAGIGVAAAAPSLAMAVATTFGTASTGTAIGSLSGAAATNAALAWLGGGALTTGGGGMIAGNALLAMAGPLGWSVAATGLGIGAWRYGKKNEQIARKAGEAAQSVRKSTTMLERAQREVGEIDSITRRHAKLTKVDLSWLEQEAPGDYTEFGEEDKARLGALVNHVRALSKQLQRRVLA